MQLRDPGWVRARANLPLARERIAPIDVPMLVMGRDGDHLQRIFRAGVIAFLDRYMNPK